MKLDSTWNMKIELYDWNQYLVGSGDVQYDVFTDGKNYDDNTDIKNIEVGLGGSVNCFTKDQISYLIENKFQEIIQDQGASDKTFKFEFDIETADFIKETLDKNGSLDSILDSLLYSLKETDFDFSKQSDREI